MMQDSQRAQVKQSFHGLLKKYFMVLFQSLTDMDRIFLPADVALHLSKQPVQTKVIGWPSPSNHTSVGLVVEPPDHSASGLLAYPICM